MDSWAEYRKMVLQELKRLDENIKLLSDSNLKVQVELGRLKIWVIVLAAVGGGIGSILLKELVSKW